MHQKLKEWKTRFRSVMLQLLMSLKSSSYQTSSAPVQPVIAESCWGPLWSETHPCFTSHKPSACSGCSKQGTNWKSDCNNCQLRSRKGLRGNFHFIFFWDGGGGVGGYAVHGIDYGVFGLIEE